jgi:hypothetical protein
MTILGFNKVKTTKYISSLRKKGYVKTKRLSNKKRVYEISFENKLGGKNYLDILKENSPVKIDIPINYTIYGIEPSLEETLIFAVKSKSLRAILSSLALFKKINNWPLLYRLSKAENIERKIGALYNLARQIMKTRKMTKRFRNLSLPKKDSKYLYIIEGLNSKDFKEIEKKWKVYIPFNKEDLEDYK